MSIKYSYKMDSVVFSPRVIADYSYILKLYNIQYTYSFFAYFIYL